MFSALVKKQARPTLSLWLKAMQTLPRMCGAAEDCCKANDSRQTGEGNRGMKGRRASDDLPVFPPLSYFPGWN